MDFTTLYHTGIPHHAYFSWLGLQGWPTFGLCLPLPPGFQNPWLGLLGTLWLPPPQVRPPRACLSWDFPKGLSHQWGWATFGACTSWGHPQAFSCKLASMQACPLRTLPPRPFLNMLTLWGLAPCVCYTWGFAHHASSHGLGPIQL
jgi:hypothetical protein